MIKKIAIMSVLLFALSFGRFGGTPSTSISGNTIIDFSFNRSDSVLLVLTTQGLSYINPYRTAVTSWKNFSSENFPGVSLLAAAFSDSTLFVSGYMTRNQGVYGGKLFVKGVTSSSFRIYDPQFRAGDDEFYRTPASIAVGDSFVFVSLNQSALIRTKKNPESDNDWRILLIASPASLQTEISNNVSVASFLRAYQDTLRVVSADTLSIKRLDSAFRKDAAFSLLHAHSINMTNARDSFFLRWQRYFFSGDTFKVVIDTFASRVENFDDVSTRIADSIIPVSIDALARRNDTLRARYADTLATEMLLSDYPPAGYDSMMQIYDIRWHEGLLFSGWIGGLTVSADNGRTQKGGLFNSPNSVLFREGKVQIPSKIFIDQKEGSDTFRVIVITKSDTIAVSAWLPDASIDSVTKLPLHLDSLKKWSFVAEGGVADIGAFKDTLFVAYSKDSQNGIRKYFQFDTTQNSVPVKLWRFLSIPLSGFLEPQLGTNVLVVVPVDTAQYDLWAGTDEGLYHLSYGSETWKHFDYKKGIPVSDEVYAFPTVIYPGFKSARFAYSLKKNANVSIEVYDYSMRKVKTIVTNAPRLSGARSDKSTEDRWDGRDDSGRAVSPGVYYFRVTAGSFQKFGKVIVYGAKDAGM